MPFSKRNLAVVASARDAGRTALLLAAAQSVGKSIVGADVIELRGRLVVPTAPGLSTVNSYYCALIASQDYDFRIVRINPDVLIIVAPGRPAKRRPRLATITRFPGDSGCDIHNIGILRIESGNGKISTANARSRSCVLRRNGPIVAAIVRAIEIDSSCSCNGSKQ